MKVDWVETFGCALATAVAIVLLIKTVAGELIAPGAMIVVAGISGAVALCLFVAVSFDRKSYEPRYRAGEEMRERKPSLFDDEWGAFGARLGSPWLAILRLVLWLQFIVAAFVFGVSSELFAAASGFAIAISVTIRQLKDVSSSQ
jgi:hypothetical protein